MMPSTAAAFGAYGFPHPFGAPFNYLPNPAAAVALSASSVVSTQAAAGVDVSRRNRRERTTFNQLQLDILEHHFLNTSQYPDA
ncbi:hypothetical protein M3Y99_00045400 [Aphelenchoides fujianensis]|nr:hypothetical protein M3Y99_00045400 [Aphelenchoides fujianensis]